MKQYCRTQQDTYRLQYGYSSIAFQFREWLCSSVNSLVDRLQWYCLDVLSLLKLNLLSIFSPSLARIFHYERL